MIIIDLFLYRQRNNVISCVTVRDSPMDRDRHVLSASPGGQHTVKAVATVAPFAHDVHRG